MRLNYQLIQKNLIDSIETDFKLNKSPSTIFPMIDDYINDNRIGLTSVFFVPDEIQNQITEKIITPLKKLDPDQYFYPPPNSLHITIFCIKIVDNPIRFSKNDIEISQKVFEKIIPKYKKINFYLEGLFDLPTSLGIRAYTDESFSQLVSELRHELRKNKVIDDKILASDHTFFSNITICRHRQKTAVAYNNWVNDNKNITIGKVVAEKVSLATSNVTFQPQKTTIINDYFFK